MKRINNALQVDTIHIGVFVCLLYLFFFGPGVRAVVADCTFLISEYGVNFCHKNSEKIPPEPDDVYFQKVSILFKCDSIINQLARKICIRVIEKLGGGSSGSAKIPFNNLTGADYYTYGSVFRCSKKNFRQLVLESAREIIGSKYPTCRPEFNFNTGSGGTIIVQISLPGSPCDQALNELNSGSVTTWHYLNADGIHSGGQFISCPCNLVMAFGNEDNIVPPIDVIPPKDTPPPITITTPPKDTLQPKTPTPFKKESPPPPLPAPPQESRCRICSSIPGTEADFDNLSTNRGRCCDCFENQGGAWTAIGCILPDSSKPRGFIPVILTFGIGIAGGIAFLLILWGGFLVLTSSGNPEQSTSGREIIQGAFFGLLLIVFGLFVLRFFGVNLLGIPGFG